jgi:glutamate racemase
MTFAPPSTILFAAPYPSPDTPPVTNATAPSICNQHLPSAGDGTSGPVIPIRAIVIGLFDSGVGGLAVLSEVRASMPEADLIFVADRARAPYGTRSLEEVRRFALEIVDWLAARGAETIVVACNTASAAALDVVRERRPDLVIVGMEPAVKPAAASTGSGTIAVFATAATFQGRLYESVVKKHADGTTVVARACPQWVELVEAGRVSGKSVRDAVAAEVEPVLDAGADVIVLGCTHFSFLKTVIAQVAGPLVEVIDPAPAVAAQAARVATSVAGSGGLQMAVSGDRARFRELVASLTGREAPREVLPFP